MLWEWQAFGGDSAGGHQATGETDEIDVLDVAKRVDRNEKPIIVG